MKNVEKLKKDFIKKCKLKLSKSRKTTKDIALNIGIGQSTVDDFFNNKSNSKLETIIKILNSINCELKV